MNPEQKTRRPNRFRDRGWTACELEKRLLLAGDVSAEVSVAPSVTQADSTSSEIIFVDSRVDAHQVLQLRANRNAEVVLIQDGQDALDQIGVVLQNRSNVTAVHVLSHARSGELLLGGQVIDASTLGNRESDLRGWKQSFAKDTDVLFYGCSLAEGDAGRAFLARFAKLTGADVAASTDRTGHFDLGGDWNLEATLGEIQTPLFASAQNLERWDVALPIVIRAAGSENTETMRLRIDGVSVRTWQNIGGDAEAGEYVDYVYENTSPVSADSVRVFLSDADWDPVAGIDENLRIDYIEIDGQVYQTEHPSVFSSATWKPEDGIVPGFRESEYLHDNGYFEFAEYTGSQITIEAAGSENTERMELWIDGVSVQGWDDIGGDPDAGQFVTYQFTAPTVVAPEQIQIHFLNDQYDPVAGIDSNLVVDKITIDGVDYQTEAANVYSTGTWADGEITPGFKESEILHAAGFFEYGNARDPGGLALETSIVDVDEDAGVASVNVLRTGGSDGYVTVDYDTEIASATPGVDYTPVAGRLTFAEGETIKTIEIPILDDTDVELIAEQFNVTIDNALGGAALLAPRTATISILDDDSGIALPDFDDFSDPSGLQLNRDAEIINDELVLTPNERIKSGSAFYETPISIAGDGSFRSSFSFTIDGSIAGGDGFTFAIHNDPLGAEAVGGRGAGIGYAGLLNGVAVEFDTRKNNFDPNDNHIAITSVGVQNPLAIRDPDFDINDGGTYYAWVEYNGTSDVMAVYVSESALKPALALLKTTVDLESIVGSDPYFGFTGGTGNKFNSHKILNWQLDLQDPPEDPPVQPADVVGVDVVNSDLLFPTAVDWLPDGTMLIAEQGGIVKTASGGVVSQTPFIDISDIVNGIRDRGLLDIAVHPDFANTPYVYLLFTYDPPETQDEPIGSLAGPDGKGNRAGRLMRVTADVNDNYLTAVAGSEVVLLGNNSTWDNFNAFANSTEDFDEPPAGENPDGTYLQDFINSDSESHTVGSLAFGVDGNLFVSIGDGASYNDVDVRADRVQDIDSLSGKILRIDPITGQGLADNPFYSGDPTSIYDEDPDSNRAKVYQLGLRNPFRISVDPISGQLFVGDVGWTQWEEINAAGPGANFGWPFYEGGDGESLVLGAYAGTPEGIDFFSQNVVVESALYALNHQQTGINAIVMGDVYSGGLYGSDYIGDVFFNDLGQGIVRNVSFDAQGNISDVSVFATGANFVVNVTQGPDGALYYVNLLDGVIGRWEIV